MAILDTIGNHSVQVIRKSENIAEFIIIQIENKT